MAVCRVQPKDHQGSHTEVDTPRPALSEEARVILERMDPDRSYSPDELHGFLSDPGLERLRQIMHELWIDRQVERVGYSAWRRARSQPPHQLEVVSGECQRVKPEELFDHAAFADFFK